MTRSFLSGRRLLLLVLLVAIVGGGVGTYLLFRKGPPPAELPGPDSPVYQEYAEAFQVGLAALDAANDDLALKRLSEAIDKIPREPAAWANRGLVRLRKNELKEAASDLHKAHELAPDSAEIANLLGWLADKQGRFTEAADHFRKALEAAPQDVATRYALANILARQGGADADRQSEEQLKEILRLQPNNLFVLHELADVAARVGDREALRDAVERLRRIGPAWSALTRRRLEEVTKAAAGPLPGNMPSALPPLVITLRSEPGYTRSKDAVEATRIGSSVQHFLRLKQVRATPAPPDTALAFASEPLPGAPAGRWDLVRAVWLTDASGAKDARPPQRAWDALKEKWTTAGADPTVLVANGREVRQVGNDAPALTFPGGPAATPPTAAGVVALDWNNDYRTDLLLAGAGGLRFYQQGEDGRFTDVTEKTGLPHDLLQADTFGAWAADVEMDGDLDLIVAPRQGEPVVLRNNRDGTFKALRLFPGVTGVRDFVWADLDNDGAADAVFLDAQGKVHLFANERLGQFRRRETPAGLGKALALAVADVTDDGVFDLLILESGGGVVRVSDRDKGKSWDVARVTEGPALLAGSGDAPPEPGSATLLTADLDNNGALDLIAATPKETRVWLGDVDGKFQRLPILPPHVFAAVDLTRDGRLDLLGLSGEGKPVRLTNRGTKPYHWQVIRPYANKEKLKEKGPVDNRMNSFAIGSEVEVRTGFVVQKQLSAAPLLHFGLGERRRADVVRIVWTHGVFQAEFEQPGDTIVVAEQRLSGSCPFLFTYDGKGMQFVTDFMWGAPLGVVIDGQDTTAALQTTSWVKIRGDQLAPRNGFYDLRVLANLWETHFYDHLALLVVDHPPGTEIHVDERAADMPLIPEVVVTGPSHPIARASDQDGRDVTDVLRSADGRYLGGFRLGRFRGVARDHWIEVDLGADAPADGPVWLLARGWVYPPSSTTYAAIAQGKHDQPQGLVLEVPDGKGGWKVGRPALGCPAGKNKTILIRLDGITGEGVPRRFRLRTNLEIYWDALAWACGLPLGVRQQKLLADRAELRRHGTVEMTQADDTAPELPHYERVVPVEQDWRDLIGYHTRYGDVRELLAAVDDRYVILTAGDEIALRFHVPAGPPAGWQRDFVWVADGWAKDGDLNTRFSKTVLPLPSHALKRYDRPPGRLEDDPVYQRFARDWQTYHTRYVTPEIFERGLRSFRRPRP